MKKSRFRVRYLLLNINFILIILVLNLVHLSYCFGNQIPQNIRDLQIEKIGNSNFLNWGPISHSIYNESINISHYNVYRSTHINYIPSLSDKIGDSAESSFTDINALIDDQNLYYYITAVSSDGTESILLSNIGYKIRISLIYNQTGTNKHWLSLPYNNNYTMASDLGSDAANISKVVRWNVSTQSEEVWDQQTGSGVNFSIVPGESYAIIISNDTVLNLVGSDAPVNLNFTYNPDNFNTNWFSLPFPNAYGIASILAEDIPNLSKVSKYDSKNDTYQSWFLLDGLWMGDAFSLNPGEGVLAVINDDVLWTPSKGLPEIVSSSDATDGLNFVQTNLSANVQDKYGTIVKYQWDYEGDGIFDYEDTQSPNTSFTYAVAGVYHPTLLVTDNDGFKAYDYQTVEVYSLENQITIDDFNPSNSDTTQFDYTVSNDGNISIKLYNGSNTLIRTLADGQAVPSGSHSVIWDGKNQLGEIVSDDVYYVVFEYEIAGKTYNYVYDPRSTTGGNDITDQITQVSVSDTLSPLQGQYVNIQYTLPQKSLVTIEIKDQTGTVIRHLLTNIQRGAGPQIDIWEGSDDSGQIVQPSTAFFVTITAISLADNAIITSGSTPALSNISAVPLRFSPATNPYGAQENNSIIANFNTNKAVTVTANVYNSSHNVIRTITETITQSGPGQIVWNGRSDAGILQSDGFYNIQIRGQDETGLYSNIFNIQVEIFY